jgi:predicted signal transduction protein with EAL and GGDEF domain
VSGHDVTLTAQTGIAIYPHDGSEAESLLSNAETALRRASSSENRTVFFTKEIGDRISQRFSMETRLRRALKNGEFVLHYQPKVDVGTRAWRSFVGRAPSWDWCLRSDSSLSWKRRE